MQLINNEVSQNFVSNSRVLVRNYRRSGLKLIILGIDPQLPLLAIWAAYSLIILVVVLNYDAPHRELRYLHIGL